MPEEVQQRLLPNLDFVPLPMGKLIHEFGVAVRYVYFPTDAIVSLQYVVENGASGEATDSIVSLSYVMRNGSASEIAAVGNEGMIGLEAIMGGHAFPHRVTVLSAGGAYRLKTAVILAEFARGGELQRLLLRYAQALSTQMALIAACNRHHSVDQQLRRWLLMTVDRLPADRLVMTQELIASALGVRRETVTEAAVKLQTLGAIDYRRGHIRVLDREQLEHSCCECYGVVRDEYDQLLPYVVPA